MTDLEYLWSLVDPGPPDLKVGTPKLESPFEVFYRTAPIHFSRTHKMTNKNNITEPTKAKHVKTGSDFMLGTNPKRGPFTILTLRGEGEVNNRYFRDENGALVRLVDSGLLYPVTPKKQEIGTLPTGTYIKLGLGSKACVIQHLSSAQTLIRFETNGRFHVTRSEGVAEVCQ